MRLFAKSLLAEKPWSFDSKVVPLPWRQDEEDAMKTKIQSGGLTLGFYSCDGAVCTLSSCYILAHFLTFQTFQVLPHPPILRGIQTVVDKAKEAGHTVVAWKPFKHQQAVDFANQVYASDAGEVRHFEHSRNLY